VVRFHYFNRYLSGIKNIVKYLFEHGADINKKCRDGATPLFNACYIGNENIIKYLVELGADKFFHPLLLTFCFINSRKN